MDWASAIAAAGDGGFPGPSGDRIGAGLAAKWHAALRLRVRRIQAQPAGIQRPPAWRVAEIADLDLALEGKIDLARRRCASSASGQASCPEGARAGTAAET
jgi:hypothetical protein